MLILFDEDSFVTVCFGNWGVDCLPDTWPKDDPLPEDDPLLEEDGAVRCLEAAVPATHGSFIFVPVNTHGESMYVCMWHTCIQAQHSTADMPRHIPRSVIQVHCHDGLSVGLTSCDACYIQ